MQRFRTLIGLTTVSLIAVAASAQTATQTVHFSVVPVSHATISEAAPISPRGLNGSYALSTNAENTKLTVSLDRPLPQGFWVTANVSAPLGAESAGPIELGAAATDLVRNIPAGTTPSLSFSFVVSAPSAPVILPGRRRVVFTFTSGV